MKKEINKEQITRIIIRETIVNDNYEFYNKKTFLGLTIQEEGYFSTEYGNYFPVQLKSQFIKDNKVYNKPYLTICLSCKTNEIIQFETDEELYDFYNKNLIDLKLLTI
jgi:hypothetical protein